jgi:hypothetical protein
MGLHGHRSIEQALIYALVRRKANQDLSCNGDGGRRSQEFDFGVCPAGPPG